MSYAKLDRNIWVDPAFTNLAMESKLFDIFLRSSPKTSLAGALDISTRRWARALGTEADLEVALDELVAAGRVVVDEETDELILTGYIPVDVNLNNQKMRTGVYRAIERIESPKLRDVIAQELLDWYTTEGYITDANGDPVTNDKGHLMRHPDVSGSDDEVFPGDDEVSESDAPLQPATSNQQPASSGGEPTVTSTGAGDSSCYRCFGTGVIEYDKQTKAPCDCKAGSQ